MKEKVPTLSNLQRSIRRTLETGLGVAVLALALAATKDCSGYTLKPRKEVLLEETTEQQAPKPRKSP